MNIALKKPLTVAEYLTRSEGDVGPRRSELINGQMVEMSPERVEHNEVKAAVYVALRQGVSRLALAHHAVTDGMTVQIDDYTAYEPDAAVYAGERLARGSMTLPNPIIVVEVLSPASAHSDRSAKLVGYFKLSSVAHYLIIDPLGESVEHHARMEDGSIVKRATSEGTISLAPPGISLDVASLFL